MKVVTDCNSVLYVKTQNCCCVSVYLLSLTCYCRAVCLQGCVFDVPCELDSEIGSSEVFSRVTELPELEEMHFTDERRFDDRQRGPSRRPFTRGGYWHHNPPPDRRYNSAKSQRFSGSSYWKNQSSRGGNRGSIWDGDED